MEATVIDITGRLARVRFSRPENAAGLVRAARQRLGLTQEEFAQFLTGQLGWLIRPGFIEAWETGIAEIPAEVREAGREIMAGQMPGDGAGEATGDSLVVPCWMDGRISWVSIDRRTFLSRGGSAALAAVAAAALPPLPGAAPARLPAVAASDGRTPVEHLIALRAVLIDSDNQLGSAVVIPVVESQVEVIRHLLDGRAGGDRRALLTLQAQFAEFAGWLHQDGRNFQPAQYWLDRSLEWSHMAGDQELTTYVILRKSQLAGDMGNAADAADLADAASHMAIARSRIAATASCFGAHGFALAGQGPAAERAIDHALDLAADVDDGSSWAIWLDEAYIQVQRARCLSTLGQHAKAAAVFGEAIGKLPESFRRDRGVYLARQALAYARARDPEQAAATGMRALDVAGDAQSGRVTGELSDVGAALARWQRLPDVIRFRDALADVIPA